MPFRAEWAEYSVQSLRNYGIRVTSRTEGAHAELKRFLRNNRANLFQLHTCILELLKRKTDAYNQAIANALSKAWAKYDSKPVINGLSRVICKRALEEIYQQWLRASRSLGDSPQPLPACTESFTAQWGLPCAHRLLPLMKAEPPAPLTRVSVDPHWWLYFDTVNILPILQTDF